MSRQKIYILTKTADDGYDTTIVKASLDKQKLERYLEIGEKSDPNFDKSEYGISVMDDFDDTHLSDIRIGVPIHKVRFKLEGDMTDVSEFKCESCVRVGFVTEEWLVKTYGNFTSKCFRHVPEYVEVYIRETDRITAVKKAMVICREYLNERKD